MIFHNCYEKFITVYHKHITQRAFEESCKSENKVTKRIIIETVSTEYQTGGSAKKLII